jgi:hypothetical protein
MTNEAAERLRADLRSVPVASGIEYRNWIALLDKALAAERKATVERIRDELDGLSLIDCSEVSFGDIDVILDAEALDS